MANPLRKTMVYLGLADEDSRRDSRLPSAPARTGRCTPRPRPRTGARSTAAADDPSNRAPRRRR